MVKARTHAGVEWTSELQGEKPVAESKTLISLCRSCHRYQGKGYR
jgi:hypothetical protein